MKKSIKVISFVLIMLFIILVQQEEVQAYIELTSNDSEWNYVLKLDDDKNPISLTMTEDNSFDDHNGNRQKSVWTGYYVKAQDSFVATYTYDNYDSYNPVSYTLKVKYYKIGNGWYIKNESNQVNIIEYNGSTEEAKIYNYSDVSHMIISNYWGDGIDVDLIINGIIDSQPKEPYNAETIRDRKSDVDLNYIMQTANNFLDKGNEEQIPEKDIQSMSNLIYTTLLVIGIILAVLVGAVLGIRFITSGLEGKAETKQLLLPYGIGLVVLFGAFTIWKIVLTILQN